MNKHKNNALTKKAQELRKNMTDEEKKIWYQFFKDFPYTVNRQKVFDYYIADFYCAQFNTVIEIDGEQHFLEKGLQKDKKRDKYFNELGIQVLRYSNYDVNYHFNMVCDDILKNFGLL